jgi:hypothetical protein
MVLYDHLPLTGINLHPVGNDSILGVHCVLDDNYVLTPLLDGYDVTGAYLIRRDIDLLAVDEKVPVVDKLAGLGPGGGQTRTPNDVVKTLLEQLEEVVAGDPWPTGGLVVVAPELTLQDPVHGAQLLLLPQLDEVVALPNSTPAVLARRVGAAIDGALLRLAKRRSGAAASLVARACVAGH